ncbi:hypothetical protein [Leptospira bouyouniensis]|nr:hypothetical protein [Leptospira bouyouniensis]
MLVEITGKIKKAKENKSSLLDLSLHEINKNNNKKKENKEYINVI